MNDPKSPLVTIILLNYNNADDTIVCLESLKLVTYGKKNIVVVDNHSKDGSLAKIKAWTKQHYTHGGIEFLALEDNFGFSGGNNAGIKYAMVHKADYVLVLNNDTMVTPDFLTKLVRTAEHDPKTGVVGCTIKHFPEADKIWYSSGFIDYLRGYARHNKDEFSGERETGFVTGCLMLFSKKAIEKAGMFDDKYFLICEDSDLSHRIKQAGFKLIINGDATIFHKVSATAGGHYSPIIQYYFHRNRMHFMCGILPVYWRIPFIILQLGVLTPAWSLVEILKGKISSVQWAWRGYGDFLQGRTGKRADLH